MSSEPESLILRMLRDMREEHVASLEAMNAQMRTVRRFYEQTNLILDRLDATDANLLALRSDMQSFRAETGKTLRQVQGDIVAMENQNIARHGETINLMNRMRDAETEIEGLKVAP